MPYDYFYNRETEQYIHYTLPKLLFENAELNKLSINAKFLYAILLDRAKASYKNGFIDKDSRVYLHFAQADIMKLLNCGRTKVSEYFSELDEPKGVGLIERRQKVGIGRSDIIYVKNFAKSVDDTLPHSRFSYLHDTDSMKFDNYQVPKMLFLDEEICKISNIAKMAYSIMLDRTKLSMSKGWQDSEGRVYIIFPQKELQQLLGCSIKTVRSALKELDIKDGVGLIDRTKQGMNNPDIIYLLDYSTTLKYKSQSKETSDNEHLDGQYLNIGEENPEHRDRQNLNTGGANPEHRDGQKVNIGGANSEHIIYSDTDSSDTDFIDTHSINQSCERASSNFSTNSDKQTDRLTDRKKQSKNEMSFSEVLKAIEYNDYHVERFGCMPEDESFFGDSNDYDTAMCTIPYWFQRNPKALKKALKFLFAYNSFCNDRNEELRILLEAVIKSLVEMIKQDHCMLDKQTVKYYQIIDITNELIHNRCLDSWLLSFKDEWSQILSERDIKRPEVYIKACIWNSLSNFQFKANNETLQGYYDCKQGFPNNKKSSGSSKNNKYRALDDEDFDVEMYNRFMNDFSDYERNETYDDRKTGDEKANNIVDSEKASENEFEKKDTEQNVQENKCTESQNRYGDSFIICFLLKMAVQNGKTMADYLPDKYKFPLPNGITFNSPNDLSAEKLQELEELYDVKLRY